MRSYLFRKLGCNSILNDLLHQQQSRVVRWEGTGLFNLFVMFETIDEPASCILKEKSDRTADTFVI